MNATEAVPFAHALSGTSERDNCNRVHNICPVSWERSSQSLPEPQTMEEHTEWPQRGQVNLPWKTRLLAFFLLFQTAQTYFIIWCVHSSHWRRVRLLYIFITSSYSSFLFHHLSLVGSMYVISPYNKSTTVVFLHGCWILQYWYCVTLYNNGFYRSYVFRLQNNSSLYCCIFDCWTSNRM